MPINWLNINAKRVDKSIKINWAIEDSDELEAFEIESSTDGKLWKNRAIVNKKIRQFIDNERITSLVYYRINAKLRTGKIEKSPIVAVASIVANNDILVYPNPFKDVINLPDLPIEKAFLINNQGQNQLILIENNQIKNLNYLPKGLYVLKLLINGNWQHIKLIK